MPQSPRLHRSPFILGSYATTVFALIRRLVRIGLIRNASSFEAGDFSDVKVVSPHGEIPWSKFSRLDDAEMRELMTEGVNRSYVFLSKLFSDPHGDAIIERLEEIDPVEKWDDPDVRAF